VYGVGAREGSFAGAPYAFSLGSISGNSIHSVSNGMPLYCRANLEILVRHIANFPEDARYHWTSSGYSPCPECIRREITSILSRDVKQHKSHFFLVGRMGMANLAEWVFCWLEAGRGKCCSFARPRATPPRNDLSSAGTFSRHNNTWGLCCPTAH
jgi:hypothetical protein